MRRQLSLFALALLVPMLAFSGFILAQFATNAREHLEDEALAGARRVSVSIDREVANLIAALDVLALSPLLTTGDWAAFQAQTQPLGRSQGLAVILRDLSGQQIVNGRVPYGQPLPSFHIAGEEAAWSSGARFYVSNVYRGPLSGKHLFSVTVPILVEGRPKYYLTLSLPVDRIHEIVLKEQPSAAWTVTIIDREGAILVRNQEHETHVEQRAADDLLNATYAREGTWRGDAPNGQPIFGAYARSAFANWRVAVTIPEGVLDAPLRQSLLLFAVVGSVLVILSFLVSSFYARRIVRPMKQLARNAGALGRGDPVTHVESIIPEVRQIGDALVEAHSSLHERERLLRNFNTTLEQEVSARTAELVQANEKLIAEAEQRERVEQQLRQAQKMEAVGQLTGGIAHDFNNLLAVITGNLDLMTRRLKMGRLNVERFASSALDAANRAATLTHRLLAFSRQQPLNPEPIDANRLVAGMSELLSRALGEEIEVETVLAGGLWRSHADPNQLESALLNLAVNARDAMGGRGRLTVETCNAHIDDLYATEHGIPAGQYILLAVTDTGEGMTPGVMARAFEPFFTTKGPSQGTGLGLSQVYGFVRQSGGHVKIYSEPGEGTTVKIYLPRFYGSAGNLDVAEAANELATGNETILLVEDEDNVRRINVETLRELGYHVFEAENAKSALAILQAEPGVTLLFTDIMLPETNGRKLADQALTLRPDLKVLFTTGYTRNAIVHNGVLDPGVHLIPKPFTIHQLAAKVREVLTEASPTERPEGD
ncbi:ATP-binding protein [Terrihabitans sp. B22-R8]|uniref:ATP-binding protein n=1 Tax=Terrihabitans sp. B22-R8 TaxID=3425128 RepID=UPI00403C65AB